MAGSLQGPSRTAALTAVARALHRNEPPPWVFDDHLALGLAGDDGPRLIGRLRAEVPAAGVLSFSRWMSVRARYAEDLVERALADGLRQYVILGAGLDSFAYRRRDLAGRLRVFEVDHPATQAWKRRRLEELGVETPSHLAYVPVDFQHQTLAEELRAAGVDEATPALFSWLGVTMYLTRDAIEATLRTIAGHAAGSRVVFTYNVPPHVLSGPGLELRNNMVGIVASLGEPFISLFEPIEIDALLRDLGFRQIDQFGPEDAIRTYFGGRTDVTFSGSERLAVATVGP